MIQWDKMCEERRSAVKEKICWFWSVEFGFEILDILELFFYNFLIWGWVLLI